MSSLLTLEDILYSISESTNDFEVIINNVEKTLLKTVFTDACVDSRRAIPSSLFIALKGENQDGHDFVMDAFQRGAVAAYVQRPMAEHLFTINLRTEMPKGSKRFSGNPSLPICLLVDDPLLALQRTAKYWRAKHTQKVIGITGSVGKSTTKEAIADVLEQRFSVLRNEGNMNNEIGLPLTLLRLSSGIERAVLEMGFYVKGEIALLCDIAKPEIGVITNIGTVHAERAGSKEKIAEGKAELVQSLPKTGWAVLNSDDEWVKGMVNQTKAQPFFYGLDKKAHIWADQIMGLGIKGIRFVMHYDGKEKMVELPFLGEHAVYTALRAAAVGFLEGLSWDEVVNGLKSSYSQIRLSVLRTACGAMLIDDSYNAAPESTLAALKLLADLQGHKIAVLGDMLELGKYEKEGHVKVGAYAAQIADELIAVGSRARTIAESARLAGMAAERIRLFDHSEDAANYLASSIKEGDVLLVKGSRGMRMERIVQRIGNS